MEIGIYQGSPISPILFLIYINRVFDTVKEKPSETMFISFMDDLGFLADGNSIREVAASLEKIRETVIRWRLLDPFIHHIAKTEAILFFLT